MNRLTFTALIAALYAAFWRWYTGSQKPLTPAEVAAYVAKLRDKGARTEILAALTHFLAHDTGRDFIMANFVKLHEHPRPTADTTPDDDPEAVLSRYSEPFLGRLLRTAGHPVLIGRAAAPAVELWGLADADDWDTVALVRYRSRRDMINAATDPNFATLHGYKLAAIRKTIAFPADPYFHAGDPRLLGALIALVALLLGFRTLK